jgi:hypothetical protein
MVRNRANRIWVATLLTLADATVLRIYGRLIWDTWAGVSWIRTALIVLVLTWFLSAVVIWIHAYMDLRLILSERRHGLFPIPNDFGEGSDV